MSKTYFSNLELNFTNNNIVNVIGDKQYDNTGLATNDILKYDGTKWIASASGTWGTPGTGTQVKNDSKNYELPSDHATNSANFCIISGLPVVSQASGYVIEIEVTISTADGNDGGLDTSFAQAHYRFVATQYAGGSTIDDTTASMFQSYVFINDQTPSKIGVITCAYATGGAAINISYDGSGVTVDATVPAKVFANVKFQYVQNRGTQAFPTLS